MILDTSTLILTGGFVTAASGLFLLVNWWRDRTAWAALWWAVSNIGSGIGTTVLSLHDVTAAPVSEIGVPLILNLSAGLAWVAAAIFNRGAIRIYPVIAAFVVWNLLDVIAGATEHRSLAVFAGAGLSGCLYSAAALEFWLARAETIGGRWPMIVLLNMEAIGFIQIAFESSSPGALFLPRAVFTPYAIIHFVEFIYAVGSAVCLVTMLKERSEAKHKTASLTDPLTGLANRRAFMDRAHRVIDQCGRDGIPVSLLAFDLDHFKAVNDTFGHPTGDHVLGIFADTLLKAVRATDITGRTGGEEFLAVLPGCSPQTAFALAGQVRAAFQEDARFVNRQRVGATVSVGIANTVGHGQNLADLIASADRALYRAKNLGRNRVVQDEIHRVRPTNDNVIRIA